MRSHSKIDGLVAFWAGVIGYASVISLIQDFIGQEAYIKMAREHWVSGWITVPIATLGLCVSFTLLRTVRKRT